MTEEDIQARIAAAMGPLIEQTAETNRISAEAEARAAKREAMYDAMKDEGRELQRRQIVAWERIAGALEARNLFPSYSFLASPLAAAECEHVYPSPWHGTAPPNCLKCGR